MTWIKQCAQKSFISFIDLQETTHMLDTSCCSSTRPIISFHSALWPTKYTLSRFQHWLISLQNEFCIGKPLYHLNSLISNLHSTAKLYVFLYFNIYLNYVHIVFSIYITIKTFFNLSVFFPSVKIFKLYLLLSDLLLLLLRFLSTVSTFLKIWINFVGKNLFKVI